MKKYILVICLILFGVVGFATVKKEHFKPDSYAANIQVQISGKHKNENITTYTLSLKNNSDATLKNSSLTLNFPVKDNENSIVSHINVSGKLPGEQMAWKNEIENIIKPKQNLLFVFDVPDEIFVNKSLLDTAKPIVEAKGLMKKGFAEEPYSITWTSLSFN